MKIAILQCDQVLEKFRPRFGDYSDMIKRMFNDLAGKFEFSIYDCQQQEYPVDVNDYDFYITTGSKSSVYEDKTWIHQLIKFIQQLDCQQKKLIGICFGHQLIAMALNGKVEKSPRGWGIGVAVNRIVSTPRWMKTENNELNIIVSHQDQVTQLTADALVIAESDFCPYFLVQWNNHFLSIQGHPEWSSDYSRTLIDDRRAILPSQRVEQALQSLSIKPQNALFTNWMLDFVIQ